jgi:hypothetical protein
MLLRTEHKILLPSGHELPAIDIPTDLELEKGVLATLYDRDDHLALVIDRKVDIKELRLAEVSGIFKYRDDGSKEPIRTLSINNDEDPEPFLAQDFVSGLTFLTDVPLSITSGSNPSCFVAETKEDEDALKSFGTDRFHNPLTAHVSTRTFGSAVSTDRLKGLMSRKVGLRLYASAVNASLATAQYRDLWRVLESAFSRAGDALVELLASYEPAQKLGFDKVELDELRILRGRASHAQSRTGLKEIIYVDKECERQLPRLKNLCERVILTKKEWGSPTIAVDEVLPLQSFMGKDGTLNIFQ